MDQELDDREFPPDAWEARIEAACRRMQQAVPPVPWLPRVMNLTALRREVRRARAGVIKPRSPRITAKEWADTLEQGIVLNQLEMRQECRDVEEERQREAERQQQILEYNRCWLEVYYLFKRMPEAADPTTEIGAQVLAMKKELRKLRGRRRVMPRSRKGRKKA